VTAVAIGLAILCQFFMIGGQLLLKRAMTAPPIRIAWLAGGIMSLTAWFFVWMSLLAHWDLSRIYPFEGINPALIVAGSALLLRERVRASGWIGVLLISIGVAIISL
jgi:uncharacterized membrane protein